MVNTHWEFTSNPNIIVKNLFKLCQFNGYIVYEHETGINYKLLCTFSFRHGIVNFAQLTDWS